MSGFVAAIPSSERNSCAMVSIEVEPFECTPLLKRNVLDTITAEDQFKDKFMDLKICLILLVFIAGVTVGIYLLYQDAPR